MDRIQDHEKVIDLFTRDDDVFNNDIKPDEESKAETLRNRIYISIMIFLSIAVLIFIAQLIAGDYPRYQKIETTEDVQVDSRFDILSSEKINDNLEIKVVVDRDTDVEYIMTITYDRISNGIYEPNGIDMKPLYNSDGSLKVRE